MTPRKLHAQSIYLVPDRAELLDQLSATSRIPKAALLREAVDLLLVKHGVIPSHELNFLRKALGSAREVIVKAAAVVPGKVWQDKTSEALRQVDSELERMPNKAKF